ncbi:hypothetical protein S40288_10320, partial [Stachybotrys chartarum IBT 40288]
MDNNTTFGNANYGFQAGVINGSVHAEFHASQGKEGIRDFHNPDFSLMRAPPEERAEIPPCPSIVIPFSRNPDFVDRRTTVDQGTIIDQIIQKCRRTGSRTALVGLGGVGKSQLAIEYAYRIRQRSPETWVFWIHASSAARFEQSIRDIADSAKIYGWQNPKANISQLVHGWLHDKTKGRWVLILDNLDNATFLTSPNGGSSGGTWIDPCHIVEQELVEEAEIIEIELMNVKDAVTLFGKKVSRPISNDASELVTTLVASLEYMPLAIVQAAAYISQKWPRCSFKQYLDDYQASDRKRAGLLSCEGGKLCRDANAKNSILISWQISFDHIRQDRPSAADLLLFMSFYGRQGIPEILLRDQDATNQQSSQMVQIEDTRETEDEETENEDSKDGWSDDNSTEMRSDKSKKNGLEDDVLVLRNYSFVTTNEDGCTFEMHRLVQLATLEWLEFHKQEEQWRHRFLTKLCKEMPTGEYENWAICRMLFLHAQSAAAQIPETRDWRRDWATMEARKKSFEAPGRGHEQRATERQNQFDIPRDIPRGAVSLFSALNTIVRSTCKCNVHERCDGTCSRDASNSWQEVSAGDENIYYTVKLEGFGCASDSILHGPTTLGNTLEEYEYARLEPGKRMIRLLKPHQAIYREDPVMCESIVCNLDSAPKFAALSYCWGPETDDLRKILLVPDGKVFMARPSLEGALKRQRARLRSEEEEWIWADAICINQRRHRESRTALDDAGYIQESQHSHDLMKRTAIAKEIGLPTHDQPRPQSLADPCYYSYWHIFTKPWFTRTWVIQEIVLAKRALGALGRFEFEWTDLEKSFQVLAPEFNDFLAQRQGLPQAERRQLALALRNFTNIMRIRKYFAAGNLDAINFMELARNFEVTEPRDKIFALLALFAESDKKGLDDYSLSAGDLFCRFAVCQAENGRAVKLLDHAGLQRKGAANTPSWVPDWTFKAESSAEIVSRCRKWLSANLRKFDSSFCVASGRALLLRGFLVDRILVAQESVILDFECNRLMEAKMGITEAFSLLQRFRELCGSVYSNVDEAFARLLILDEGVRQRGRSLEKALVDNALETYRRLMGTAPLDIENLAQQEKINIERYTQLFMSCKGRRFAITLRGYLALVPKLAQEDDTVIVFPGAAVPHILRHAEDAESFLLIGDAYIHALTPSRVLQYTAGQESVVML